MDRSGERGKEPVVLTSLTQNGGVYIWDFALPKREEVFVQKWGNFFDNCMTVAWDL